MLTKSQARTFFLVGTGLCAIAFIGLTVDTFRRIPAQTRADQLTPLVVEGKHLWDSKNCMGCHTIFGEGAYYAPELTRVYERRGEAFIRAQLADPEKMFPGQRKMTNYHFAPAEIDALVEFLKWVGTVDLNGFPAKPKLTVGVTPAVASAAMASRPVVFNQICVACHSLGGAGGKVGPALDGVANRLQADYLKKWISDPPGVKPDTKMPRLPLTEAQIDELVGFLSTQKG